MTMTKRVICRFSGKTNCTPAAYILATSMDQWHIYK